MGSSDSPLVELLIVFVAVYLLQLVTAPAGLVGSLFVLSAPLAENPWTVVTSVYAHGGIGHLLSNAVSLVVFGWPVARATTRIRFHVFFVSTGSLAGISQVLFSDVLAGVPLLGFAASPGVLGASGGVFGVLGYLLASNRLSSTVAAMVTLPLWAAVVGVVVLAGVLTLATASPGAALIAHFAGLVFGLGAGRLGLLRDSA
jgi:membrane associated rhomboid family serine protease